MLEKETYTLQDKTLLHRWQNGDESAFSALYLKYIKELVRLAYRKLGDATIAEEVSQIVFLKFYEKGMAVQGEPFPYLNVMLKNEIANYYRNNISHLPIDFPSEDYIYPAENAIENYINNKELLAQYEKGIEMLPAQCRKVFLLRRENNMSNKEVARQLGISVNTVEQHMRKAIKILKEYCGYELIILLIIRHL